MLPLKVAPPPSTFWSTEPPCVKAMVVVSGAARDAASAAADVDARQQAAVHPCVLLKPPVLRLAPSYMFSRRVCDRDALATPACKSEASFRTSRCIVTYSGPPSSRRPRRAAARASNALCARRCGPARAPTSCTNVLNCKMVCGLLEYAVPSTFAVTPLVPGCGSHFGVADRQHSCTREGRILRCVIGYVHTCC